MKQIFRKHSHAVRGFSLLELMVAVAISMMLLMGVVALFVSSRASYETTERLSRIQENGRYALDQFTADIRAAGFQGCARAPVGTSRAMDFAISSLRNSATLLWNFAVPAQGFQGLGGGNFAPALPAGLLNPAPSGAGDILVLRVPRRDAQSIRLTTSQASPDLPLQVGNVSPMPLRVGDSAMITDCEGRAWFEVTSVGGGAIGHAQSSGTTQTLDDGSNIVSPGNSMASLLHPFKRGAQIVPVTTVIYYLAPRPNDDPTRPPPPNDPTRLSLWRKTAGAQKSEEIAEGIDRFEVQYGVDTGVDGRVDSYVDASGITSWDRVYSVQIALLARSPDAYGTDRDNVTYTLFSNPASITAGPYNDRNQRKVFTATIAVRNQITD